MAPVEVRVCAPTSAFSSSVMLGKRRRFWKVRAIPFFDDPVRLQSSCVFAREKDVATIRFDEAGDEIDVVLPEPFGSMMPTIEPGMTSRSIRFTALMPPNDFARFLISS